MERKHTPQATLGLVKQDNGLYACPVCGGQAFTCGLHKPVNPWICQCIACGHRTDGQATDKMAKEAWNREAVAKAAKVA